MIMNALNLREPYRGTAKSLILLVQMCQQVVQGIIAFTQYTVDVTCPRNEGLGLLSLLMGFALLYFSCDKLVPSNTVSLHSPWASAKTLLLYWRYLKQLAREICFPSGVSV